MEVKPISKQALLRLPVYLNCLKEIEGKAEYISSPAIAERLKLNEVQVRKDLAAVSRSAGSPKKGFVVQGLIDDIKEYLGYKNTTDAILVGAGQLGRALLSYRGFREYGLKISAAFDIDTKNCPENVMNISELPHICKRLGVRMGIITVPAGAAQSVCDLMVENGICAIWNFAPVSLRVPENILVQNENMASGLAVLSAHLRERLRSTR